MAASAPISLPDAPLSSSARASIYAALFLQTLISAGTYLVAKQAMTELDPFTLVISRFLVCGGVFCLVLLALPGRRVPPRSAWRSLVYLGFLVGPLNQGLFFYGLERSRPAHAALLYALTPLGVYLGSVLRGYERLSRRSLLGIGFAFSGVLALLLGRGLQDASGPLVGDLFILGAVIAWVFYTADGKAFIAEHGPIRATAWSMMTAALLILLLAPFTFQAHRLAAASPVTLVGIGYLGLMTSVISYLLWYYALSKTRPSKVAVFSNLQPVMTALAAWALLGDPLHWELAVGGALVLAGVRLTQTA